MQGKRTLLGLVILGSFVMGLLFIFYGYEQTWKLWNIPVMSPHFADLRSITGGAESYALGYDPLLNNPQDPWERRMNYPRVWQLLFSLGLDQSHTTLMGIVFIALFIVGLFLFVGRINHLTAIFLALGIFSPAVLLGIERGNNDLFIFFILSVALSTVRVSPFVSILLTNLAVILKVFPFFGVLYLLKDGKRTTTKWLSVSFVIPVLYFFFTFSDLVQIRQGTQKGRSISYGAHVFGRYLGHHFHSPLLARFLFILLSGLVILILLAFIFIHKKYIKEHLPSTPYMEAFRMGSGIYIGTFTLGNNWDYRLIFLLFTIPQLVAWGSHSSALVKWSARLTTSAMMISLWSLLIFRPLLTLPILEHIAFLLDELANWIVLAGLLYLLIYSLPPWLCHEIDKLGSLNGFISNKKMRQLRNESYK
jgi:hypothetical protein